MNIVPEEQALKRSLKDALAAAEALLAAHETAAGGSCGCDICIETRGIAWALQATCLDSLIPLTQEEADELLQEFGYPTATVSTAE